MKKILILLLIVIGITIYSSREKTLSVGEAQISARNILDSQDFVEKGKTIVKYSYKSDEVKPKIEQDVIEKQYETYSEEVNGKTIEKQKLDKQGFPILKSEKRIISEEIIEKRTAHTITSRVIGEDNKFFTQSGYNFVKDAEGWKEVKYATTTKTEFDRAAKVSLLGLIKQALAYEVGPNSPNAVENWNIDGGDVSWVDLNNLKVSDDVYTTNTTVENTSIFLYASAFGISVPTDSTITGLKAEIDVKQQVTSSPWIFAIYNATSTVTKGYSSSSIYPSSTEATYTLGGDGLTSSFYWTPTDINSNSFGIFIAGNFDGAARSNILYADHARATVYYKLGISSSTKSTVTIANNNATGTVAWNNPLNASSSNNVYATTSLSSGQVTNYLEFSDFGFSIPSGTEIEGIMVSIEAKTSGYLSAGVVESCFLKDSVNYCDPTTLGFGTSDSILVSGGTQSDFGRTWTNTEINNANFTYRMAFKQRFSTPTVSVDAVTITIFYSDAVSNTKTQIRSSSQFKSSVIIK